MRKLTKLAHCETVSIMTANHEREAKLNTLVFTRQRERGVGGIFCIPPWPKIFRKYTPPGDFGSSRHFVF